MSEQTTHSESSTRLWMTGSQAVVMASLLPGRGVAGEEPPRSARLARTSPYDVAETVERIEAAARRDGLSVLMRLDGAHPVIVLASSVGGTPVVMHRGDPHPEMPLSVQVRRGETGRTEVLLAGSADPADSDWTELPSAAAADLARLPAMLERALG